MNGGESSMTYTRIAGDEEYRAVSLANSIVPKFTPFRNDGQTINYVGDTVLEIKRTDGSTEFAQTFPVFFNRKSYFCSRRTCAYYGILCI